MGKIVNNEMIVSEFGKIVEIEWFKSFEIRNELFLHDFVLMPNHLHTIVEIYNGIDSNVETHGRASLPIDGRASLPIDGRASLPIEPIDDQLELSSIKQNPPIRLPKSISSFIAGFKSAVNTKIDEHQLNIPKYNKNNHFFQPNYHDHVIRNQLEYQTISNYIINNPVKWAEDKFYV